MSTSLYKLYLEIGKMEIPYGYEIGFAFNEGYVRISLKNLKKDLKTAWVVSPKELEMTKLDFIRDHLQEMLKYLEEHEAECSENWSKSK